MQFFGAAVKDRFFSIVTADILMQCLEQNWVNISAFQIRFPNNEFIIAEKPCKDECLFRRLAICFTKIHKQQDVPIVFNHRMENESCLNFTF